MNSVSKVRSSLLISQLIICMLLTVAGCEGETTTVHPPGDTVPAPRLGE